VKNNEVTSCFIEQASCKQAPMYFYTTPHAIFMAFQFPLLLLRRSWRAAPDANVSSDVCQADSMSCLMHDTSPGFISA